MNKKATYRVIGIMSGSSLDGLDIADCSFEQANSRWHYLIEHADTIPYDNQLAGRLTELKEASAETFAYTDIQLGRFIGNAINRFIRTYNPGKVDYIASHGHTVFHNPSQGYSTQIGNGAIIAASTNIPAITDFRSLDVALGGQGAPLVPIGDACLFPEYDYCLNLGGYSNISFDQNGTRVAFDICPVNKAINYLANQAGKIMDRDGKMASQGSVDERLLENLNNLGFYHSPAPKSLGDEWLNTTFLKVLKDASHLSIKDQLRTVYEHIAIQIHEASAGNSEGSILVTGGGAHNQFLMDRIRERNNNRIIVPESKLVEFKEALIFAFMGVLRSKGINNCLASVTGASGDSSGGVIYLV
ncbi:MAG: anhydro-N-acetylmuramic acid kinase [Bacteroidales bacterium]|nr:anhydro-N-acetylmuramic acid kinase [Bacteroidales bacterium]MBS3774349.1 anhydro-N-acetylmuramic acid kinase [Bacteroidales bacterium]